MTHTALQDAVLALHHARLDAVGLRGQLQQHRDVFELQYADLIRHVKEAQAAVDAADLTVRALAEAQYAATKETKPAPGVEIKMRTTYLYDDAAALAWAKETKMALLPESLDRKALEKIAKATPLPFVLTDQEPQVTIATDLAKVLPAPEHTLQPVTTTGCPF